MQRELAFTADHAGRGVSKSTLLNRLLPLSFVCLFGALAAAASFYPAGYNWRIHVISKLVSPESNPRGYWMGSFGILAAVALSAPFAGYVAKRLRAVTRGGAELARWTFLGGFVLLFCSQLMNPIAGMWRMHTILAQAGAGFFIAGMVCCCGCALRDRYSAERTLLPSGLTLFWILLTLVPVVLLVTWKALHLTGGQAEQFRQSFRHTVFWRLAFWEWVGVIAAFGFFTGSVALLPETIESE